LENDHVLAKMILKKKLDNPKPLMTIGLVFIALGQAWPRLLPVTGNLGPDWIDGIKGLLMGIAIGLLGWSVILNKRLRAGRRQ
jgi:hypothetical protein